MLNDQKIYELMAKTPNIRAVQIADSCDAELIDVSAALRSLVDVGDIVQSKGFAPNGLQAMCYNLSETFMKSREYGVIMAILAARPKAPERAEPVRVEPVDDSSRADRGVVFVNRATAPVSDDQLRTAMGLTKGQYPSMYLKMAIKNGRLHKDARGWVAGSSKLPAASFNTPFVKPKPGVVAQFPGTAQPEPAPVVAAPKSGDVFTSNYTNDGWSPQPQSAFRCGIWSDGSIEIQRDGVKAAEISDTEFEMLVAFMARVRGTGKVAA